MIKVNSLSPGIQHVYLPLTGCRLGNEHRLNCANEYNCTWRLTADFQIFEEIHLMQGKTNGIGFHSSINVLLEAHPATIKTCS
jgi:hypothetical protein